MYSTKDKKLKNKLKRMRITLQPTRPYIPEEEEPIPSPKKATFVNSWWGATSTQASHLY